ncbi:MAG TPA: hypothetical protein VKD67_02265 [Acidimicrobiales bacterium]|nr:hypothetical protein [Acidimicrobiales bacterium]
MTRVNYETITGHPTSALSDAGLWPLAAVVIEGVALAWLWPRASKMTRVPVGVWFRLVLLTLAFGVRNVPALSALAP